MAATEERIAEIPTDLEVDPVTLDIIESALRHARFEMDAVLFRSAMSPGHPRAARRVPDAHRPAAAAWSSASSAPTSTR